MLGKEGVSSYKIAELLQSSKKGHKGRKTHADKDKSIPKDTQNLKITSPFYQRTQCNRGSTCKCPFHPLKKIRAVPSLQRLHKQQICSLHQQRTKMARLHTSAEGSDGDELICNMKNTLNSTNNHRTLSNHLAAQADYEGIDHKVDCRNQIFEQFLKTNDLYILKGSGRQSRAQPGNQTSQGFHKSIMGAEFGDSRQRMGLNLNNTVGGASFMSKDKKLMDSKISSSYFGFGNIAKLDPRFKRTLQECEKIRILIEMLVTGKKKMNLGDMRKLAKRIKKNMEDEARRDPSSSLLVKMSENLQKLVELIRREQILLKETRSKQANRRSLERNNIMNRSSQKKMSYQQSHSGHDGASISGRLSKGEGSRNSVDYQSKTIGRVNRSSFKKHEKDQKSRKENLPKKLRFDSPNNKDKSNQHSQQDRQQNEEYGLLDNLELQEHEEARPNEQNTNIKKSRLLRSRRKQTISQYFANKKFLTEQTGYQSYMNMKPDGNLTMYKFFPKTFEVKNKNQRSQNLKEIINSRTKDDQTEINNFEHLRNKIHKNRKFINKIRRILEQMDLSEFIIRDSDSLITQKKKIRHLSEMVTQSRPSNFSNQLGRYLGLYSDHCSQILRKPLLISPYQQKSISESIHGKALQKQEFTENIHELKELNKSLKFIDLNIPEEQREVVGRREVNEFQIPQFVTHDGGRGSDKIEAILHKINSITSFSQTQNQPKRVKIDGDLIQKDLETHGTLETPLIQKFCSPKLVSHNSVRDPFKQKLDGYRKLFKKPLVKEKVESLWA